MFPSSSGAIPIFPSPTSRVVLHGLDFAFPRDPEAELWGCVENSRHSFCCVLEPLSLVFPALQSSGNTAGCALGIWDWDSSVPLILEFDVKRGNTELV